MRERRKTSRVGFERGIAVHIMAIDGTWRRSCVMEEISTTDVLLTVEGSMEKLSLDEFFLVLSSTGLAFRRCALLRVNSNQIAARFLENELRKAIVKRATKAGAT